MYIAVTESQQKKIILAGRKWHCQQLWRYTTVCDGEEVWKTIISLLRCTWVTVTGVKACECDNVYRAFNESFKNGIY